MSYLISVDAGLVLSGAVLTEFVGVTGLLKRMALDRALPQFFLRQNRRGTTHWIIIGFFLVSASIIFMTEGALTALAGVYTISFLSVMALFGVGNVLLKVKRARLPRPSRASWVSLLLGIPAVVVALTGNVLMNPVYFRVFMIYFVPTLLVVYIMLGRIGLLKASLFLLRKVSQAIGETTTRTSQWIHKKIDEINSQQVVFFTRGDQLHHLNEAMLYVRRNEHTNRIKVVTVVKDDSEIPARLKKDLKFLDEAYPDVDIEFVVHYGKFGPKLIRELSKEWDIPVNFMFIGSPGDHLMYGLAELGGVRLIV